jgi:predicted PurR-regulated permease PerM
MAEAKPGNVLGIIDRVFDRFSSYLSERISAFVAFLFMLIALGSFYGYFIVPHFAEFAIYLLMAPVVLALIAYYNRTFASILFVLLLFFVFLI